MTYVGNIGEYNCSELNMCYKEHCLLVNKTV